MNTKEIINILLVEDAKVIVESVRIQLSRSHQRYLITHAETLKEAKEKLLKNKFDVILLDLGLPDSDGLNTFHAIRGLDDAPIIIFTATSDREIWEQAAIDGAEDYLIKGKCSTLLLIKSILFAIERYKRRQAEIELIELRRVVKELRDSQSKLKS